MARSKNIIPKKNTSLAKEGTEEKKTRKQTRFHPGTVALRDIRKAQKSTSKSFRKASFRRLSRGILHTLDDGRFSDFRITANAYRAMQETAESWLTGLFREANRSARNAKRIKITAGDFRLVHDLVTCNGLDELMNEKLRYNFNGNTVVYDDEDVEEPRTPKKSASSKDTSKELV